MTTDPSTPSEENGGNDLQLKYMLYWFDSRYKRRAPILARTSCDATVTRMNPMPTMAEKKKLSGGFIGCVNMAQIHLGNGGDDLWADPLWALFADVSATVLGEWVNFITDQNGSRYFFCYKSFVLYLSDQLNLLNVGFYWILKFSLFTFVYCVSYPWLKLQFYVDQEYFEFWDVSIGESHKFFAPNLRQKFS